MYIQLDLCVGTVLVLAKEVSGSLLTIYLNEYTLLIKNTGVCVLCNEWEVSHINIILISKRLEQGKCDYVFEQGALYDQPEQSILKGKSPKFTMDLYCFIPPIWVI